MLRNALLTFIAASAVACTLPKGDGAKTAGTGSTATTPDSPTDTAKQDETTKPTAFQSVADEFVQTLVDQGVDATKAQALGKQIKDTESPAALALQDAAPANPDVAASDPPVADASATSAAAPDAAPDAATVKALGDVAEVAQSLADTKDGIPSEDIDKAAITVGDKHDQDAASVGEHLFKGAGDKAPDLFEKICERIIAKRFEKAFGEAPKTPPTPEEMQAQLAKILELAGKVGKPGLMAKSAALIFGSEVAGSMPPAEFAKALGQAFSDAAAAAEGLGDKNDPSEVATGLSGLGADVMARLKKVGGDKAPEALDPETIAAAASGALGKVCDRDKFKKVLTDAQKSDLVKGANDSTLEFMNEHDPAGVAALKAKMNDALAKAFPDVKVGDLTNPCVNDPTHWAFKTVDAKGSASPTSAALADPPAGALPPEQVTICVRLDPVPPPKDGGTTTGGGTTEPPKDPPPPPAPEPKWLMMSLSVPSSVSTNVVVVKFGLVNKVDLVKMIGASGVVPDQSCSPGQFPTLMRSGDGDTNPWRADGCHSPNEIVVGMAPPTSAGPNGP